MKSQTLKIKVSILFILRVMFSVEASWKYVSVNIYNEIQQRNQMPVEISLIKN